MKIIKMIKVVSISLIAGAVVATSAYAQNMDVTMDVVKQSDAQNITERVMNRIDLPEPARNAGTFENRTQERDSMHSQDRWHMDDRYQMREGTRDAMGDSYQMRDDSYQMREDVRDVQNDVRQMRGGH